MTKLRLRSCLIAFAALATAALLASQVPSPRDKAGAAAWLDVIGAAWATGGGSAPLADAGADAAAAVGTTVVLDGSGSSHPNGDELTLSWAFVSVPAGSAAVLSDSGALKPSFELDLAGDYLVQLTASDGSANSASDTVIVSSGNVAPVADAGPDQTVDPGDPVRLDASDSSDVNGDPLGFTWSLTGKPPGSTAALDEATALRPSFTADLAGEYMVSLTVGDGALTSVADEVRISTYDSHPVAEAGPDQKVAVGQTVLVRLEGLFDVDGELIEERDWSIILRPSGSTADFLPNKNRRFIIDQPGTYVVQRMTIEEIGGDDDDDDGDVFNGGSFSGFDTVILTTDANIRPVADAGADQSVLLGDPVKLRGAGSSDLDGDRLTYRWALTTVPAGSTAVLNDPAAVNPDFEADLAGSYVAQLIVKDGAEESRPDTVIITTGNSRPVADAGLDQQKPKHNTITLDGSASRDADGDSLTYDWSLTKRPSASSATLNNPTAVDPSFFTDTGRRFVAQLIVRDGDLASAPDNVVVGPGNMRPVAEAGPDQEVAPGRLVQLDGTGSFDAANDPLVFQWALLSAPEGSQAALAGGGTATPTFTADLPGVYVAQLVVTDDDVAPLVSDPDTVVIAINNQPPVADAGPDQVVRTRGFVTLDGNGSSDPDGDAITYFWSLGTAPVGSSATLADGTTARPTLKTDVAGDYVVQLVVNDGVTDSAPDLVVVAADSNPPLAEAGPDQVVGSGATVQLDGSASADPEGRPLTFAWRFTAKPTDSAAELAGPNTDRPGFTADLPGLYVAELTVSDGAYKALDTVAVRVGAGPGNSPPTFDLVGAQAVALGSTLTLTLTGSDPDGDAIFFRVDPSPLPAGASLDAMSGVFSFTPDATQVGDIVLTFIASDGLASDSESVTITVNPPAPGTLTAFSARVLDADAFHADGSEIGVVGATVAIHGSTASALTAADGRFTLSGIAAGSQLLTIDTSTATPFPDPAPGGSGYAGLNETVELIADVINQRNAPFFLMRIDPATLVTVDPAGPTVVQNPSVAGVRLDVAQGSTTATALSVSVLPTDLAPASLPPSILPCQIVKVLPFGATFSPAASLTLPNLDNLPAGTAVDLWGLDPATGGFRVLGQGSVVSATEMTATSLITTATYLFAVPRAPVAKAANDENAVNKTPTLLADGNLSASITLPSYRSLGQDRALTFVYNSTAADPRPTIAVEVTFPAGTGLPPLIEGRLEVGGVEVAGPVFTDTTVPDPRNGPGDPPLVAGDTIRQAISFDASQFATGSYPYRYTATANFGCSKVSAVSRGRVLIDNQSESPFGAGWTLAELASLVLQDDGRVVLSEGDGTIKTFELPTFLEPVGFPVDGPGTMAIDDLNGDGMLDMAIPAQVPGDLVLLFGDGAGDFPETRSFDAGGPINAEGFPDTHIVVTGDFNDDGVRDLVVNNQNADQLRVYIGSGGGVYEAPRFLGIGRPQGLAVADFNRDGHEDIAVSTSAGSIVSSRTRIYFGDGTGNFPIEKTLSLGLNQTSLEVADFNNDGNPDFVVAVPGDNRIVVAINDGAANFAILAITDIRLNFTIARFALAVADYDLDRNADIAVTTVPRPFDQGSFLVLFGDGTGKFPVQATVPTGLGGALSVAAGDINGDGIPDIVTSGFKSGGIVGVLLSDGARGFRLASTTPVAPNFVSTVALADFDADGALDAVSGSFADKSVFLLKSNTSIGAGTAFLSPGADFSQLTRTADGFVRRMTDGTVLVFNEQGQLTSRSDRNGNEITYAYDSEGRIASVTDPADPTRSTTMVYDGNGISSVTEPTGRTVLFRVDGNGDLVSVTNADGSLRRFVADANRRLIAQVSERGFLTSNNYGFAGQYIGSGSPDGASITANISKSLGLAALGVGLGTEANPAPYARPNGTADLVDPRGNPYKMRFNAFGSAVEIIDPLDRTTELTRNADNLVTRIVQPSDGRLPGTEATESVTELDYDERGNFTSRREAVGTVQARETRFFFEPEFNNITKIADPTNSEADPQCGTAGVTCFAYDAKGNLESVTGFVDGAPITPQTSTYDPRGLELTRIDANGNETQFVYGLLGNLERIVDAELNEIDFVLDAAGRLATRTEGFGTPEARTTGFTYDALNRVLTETEGAGGTVTSRYDGSGNVIETEDATGIVTARAYDEQNRLILEDAPIQESVRRTYDKSGNLETIGNALNGTVSLVYDTVNRVEKATDPLLNERLFTYDAQNNLASMQDARQVLSGGATTFVYDHLNRQVERTNALSQSWSFRYDSRDNRTRIEDPKGQTIFQRYDELSRLEHVELVVNPDAGSEDEIDFTYDANGNRLTATDSDSSLAWTYDKLNRVETAQTLADPDAVQPAVVLTYDYDAVSNRTALRHGPNELVVDGNWTYAYDGAGRLTGLVNPGGDSALPVTLSYDLADRLTGIDYPNGVATQALYDLDGRPETIAHTRALIDLARFDYGYRGDGAIESIVEAGGTRNLSYDEILQLIAGGFDSALESYAYDAEGNRLASHFSSGQVYDAVNRLTEDDSFCYEYDENGNLFGKTAKLDGLCAGAESFYEWDIRNRLVAIETAPGSTLFTYRYDALGRRIEKDVDGAVTRYVYDGENIVLEYDGVNTLAARYSHGDQIDQPLVLERSGQNHYYHIDHLGSIRKLTNVTGLAVNSYDTDSFGRFETRIEGVANPYTFTAREFDPESGLHFYRARYYDPSAGRFISEDPIGFAGGDTNLYRYVYNSPILFGDPSGQSLIAKEYIDPADIAYAVAILGYVSFFVNEIRKGDRCTRLSRSEDLWWAAFGGAIGSRITPGAGLKTQAAAFGALAAASFIRVTVIISQALTAPRPPRPGVRRADPCD